MRSIFAFVWFAVASIIFAVGAHAQSAFDPVAFGDLATRAEVVIEEGQASSDALETLRGTLSDARSAALDAQSDLSTRVASIREQIAVLAADAADIETAEVTARRDALNQQLAVANTPLVVAQEAYQRADGLISEIDRTIRERNTETLFEFGDSAINPVNWGTASTDFSNYVGHLVSEIKTASENSVTNAVRSQRILPAILTALIGLLLMFPASRWVSHKMRSATARAKNIQTNIFRLALSILVFLVPFVGFLFLVSAFGSMDFLGLQGELLLQALPAAGLAIFVAIWLGRNLFVDGGPAAQLMGLEQSRLRGAFNLTILLGVVVAISSILNVIANSADFSTTTHAVLQFPLILIGGYALVMFGRKITVYRNQIQTGGVVNPISDRITLILYYLCIFAGIGGPIAAAVGYANVAALLVFSTILTLGVLAGFFIFYTLLALFVSDFTNPDRDAETTKGGLFRVLLAFALVFAALPLLALIWGARISDLQELWISLSEGVKLGETRVSFSDFITFVLIFSIGYTLTRLFQSALRSAVLPNTNIDEGAQNAVVTGFGYFGIFIAALLAIMSTGLDLSSLAIVAGALSVGIGFGLQNIVSNFVSGIILLIERPLKLGEWVQVGTSAGYVTDISVRATTIETFDQADVIIPNADFISGTVTNMTHHNKRGRVKVPVGVAYDSDPERVKELLLEIVSGHDMILKKPAPSVFLLGFGADSIDFEIRGILRDVNYILSTRSDINFEILKVFAKEGIEIPFGQREIRIKNAAELGKALKAK
jgi:small-conductance mechanosensitive channel